MTALVIGRAAVVILPVLTEAFRKRGHSSILVASRAAFAHVAHEALARGSAAEQRVAIRAFEGVRPGFALWQLRENVNMSELSDETRQIIAAAIERIIARARPAN